MASLGLLGPVSATAALNKVMAPWELCSGPQPGETPCSQQPRQQALATASRARLSSGRCCQALRVFQVWPFPPAFHPWKLPCQGGALCQGRTSALDSSWNPYALAHGSGLGAVLKKFSVNE